MATRTVKFVTSLSNIAWGNSNLCSNVILDCIKSWLAYSLLGIPTENNPKVICLENVQAKCCPYDERWACLQGSNSVSI